MGYKQNVVDGVDQRYLNPDVSYYNTGALSSGVNFTRFAAHSVAMSGDGSIVLVADFQFAGYTNTFQGWAGVFIYNTDHWEYRDHRGKDHLQQEYARPANTSGTWGFGWKVEMSYSGDTIVISSLREADGSTEYQGFLYVYKWDSSLTEYKFNHRFNHSVTNSNNISGGTYFGQSLAM